MRIQILIFLVGLIGLWLGSGLVVKAAKRLAEALKISDLVIGLTIVSIGTSLPEIATTVSVGLSNRLGIEASGIGLGDILGSNFANITFVLGIAGLFATFYIQKKALRREGISMLGAILILFFTFLDSKVTQQEGLILIFIYIFYLFYLCRQEQAFVKFKKKENKSSLLVDVFFIIIGVIVVAYSAHFVVDNGVIIARLFGLKEFIIGLFIGLGTSLPELSVSIRALTKGAGSLSLGNILGSGITNALLAMGAGAVISDFTVSRNILFFDFPVLFLTTALVLILLNRNLNLGRKESILLLGVYAAYLFTRIFFFSN